MWLFVTKNTECILVTVMKPSFIYIEYKDSISYRGFPKIFQGREALILSNPNQTERYFLISIYYLHSTAQMKGYQSERQTD